MPRSKKSSAKSMCHSLMRALRSLRLLPRLRRVCSTSSSNLNVKGAYFTIQKALPLLNDNASIILNTSVADQKGNAGLSAYAATKAALRSLARTAAAELVGRHIRVNTVAPGPIETPIFGRTGIPRNNLMSSPRSLRRRCR